MEKSLYGLSKKFNKLALNTEISGKFIDNHQIRSPLYQSAIRLSAATFPEFWHFNHGSSLETGMWVGAFISNAILFTRFADMIALNNFDLNITTSPGFGLYALTFAIGLFTARVGMNLVQNISQEVQNISQELKLKNLKLLTPTIALLAPNIPSLIQTIAQIIRK